MRTTISSFDKYQSQLPQYAISQATFNKILMTYPAKIRKLSSEDIWNCFWGTKYTEVNNKKHLIYTDNEQYIVIEIRYLNLVLPDKYVIVNSTWREAKLVLVPEQTEPITKEGLTGLSAYMRLMRLLKQDYSVEEIHQILRSYTDEKNEADKQIHYDVKQPIGTIWKYTNCAKYDINGAHAYFLTKIFPKSEKRLLEFYNKKDEYKKLGMSAKAKEIKDTFNLSVGMIKHKGYEGAYWWIVHQTTRTLRAAINETFGDDSMLIYANTDGFCISNPARELPTSSTLGEFKLEMRGDYFVYSGENNRLYQYISSKGEVEKVGTTLMELRPDFDLFTGNIVEYKREYIECGEGGVYVAKNKKKKKLKVEEVV